MPDGRFLSKSIAYSAQVGSVSFEADYLFMRMIPHLDCKGRLSGDPRSVKALCCPLRDEMTNEVVGAALEELASAGLIQRYEHNGAKWLSFPGFVAHQRGARLDREAPSRIPDPPPYSGPTPESVRTTPDQLRASEVKGSEGKRRTTPSRTREAGEGNWVSRLTADFKASGGTVREGHLGQALKPAHERFGEAILRTAIGLWLSERKAHGWSCAFAKFAADHVRWCEEAVRLHEAAMSGVDYWDNDALQRITRPSLVA